MAQKSQKTGSKTKADLSTMGFYKPLLGVLIITFLAFSNFSSLDFVSYDDGAYVFDNPVIKSLSFKNIATIFTSFSNANYHPLTILFYAIEFQLFGLNAAGYHFINILLHLINTALVFLLILKISKRNEVAIICALFFGIHPMHVESVIWISELKDLLYSMFYLGAMYYYCKYISNSSAKNYFIVIAFFVLSLLSKSAAITLPLVLCVLDFYYQRGISRKVILEKIPFVILSALFCAVTIASQKSIGAINTDWMPKYSLIQRFFVVSYGVCFYIWELFLPIGLSAIHYAPKIIPSWFYVMPVLLAALAVSVWKVKILRKEIIFGIAFYLFTICLTLQIIPVGYAIVSERYSYLPYIGLFFVIRQFYVAVAEGKISWAKKLIPYINYIFIAFAIFCFALTYNRNQVWKDGISLYKDVVEKYPGVSYAHFSMGQNFQAAGELNDGLASFNRSIELDSSSAEVYFFRGTLLYAQKNYDAAVKDFKTAIALKPNYAEAIYNLGICYSTMGNYQESINTTTKSIGLKPNEQMYESRAKAFFNLKEYKEAIDDFTIALKLDPKSAESLFYRGISFYNYNQKDNACNDLKQASSLGYINANQYINAYCK
jgi:protein O-mannosyl-transferase